MTVIHVTTDFPDTVAPNKTRAIQYLVESTADALDYRLYSLNRSDLSPSRLAGVLLSKPLSPPFQIAIGRQTELITTITYDAPRFGLYMVNALTAVANRIGDDLERRDIRPTVFHGHKLTMEGLIVSELAARFSVPYILSIQGNTDQKIFAARPDLRKRFKRLFHDAAIVFPFSVASMRFFDRVCGPRPERDRPTVILPCSSPQDRIIAPRETPPLLCSIFNLMDYKNKNIGPVLKGSARLEKTVPDYGFDLYGGGEDRHVRAIRDLAEKAGATRFDLKGAIPHDTVQQTLNGHCGMVQVSRRETFGMVYIEALLAGCPVVYPKDWAIDGFFDDARFAIAVPSNDDEAIEDAMRTLVSEQRSLKAEIAEWQEAGRFDIFRRDAIRRTYLDALKTLLPAA